MRLPREAIILPLMAYCGMVQAVHPVAAPSFNADFGLDAAGTARLFALLSSATLGSLLIARWGDGHGRRRVLLACTAAMPLSALGAAASQSLVGFAIFELLLLAATGAALATAIIWISESLEDARRARGQGRGGIAVGLGSGVPFVLLPFLEARGYDWRGILWLAGLGILALPFAWRLLPESLPPRPRLSYQATLQSLTRPTRRVAAALLAGSLVVSGVLGAANSWRFFHAISDLGLETSTASVIMLVVGAMGLLGYPLGARLADRFGRVPTAAGAASLLAASIVLAYWGPPAGFPWTAAWIGPSYLAFGLAANVLTVAGNCAFTESLPAPVRGTMAGLFNIGGAASQMSAQGLIAVFAPGLGVALVVGSIGLAAFMVTGIYLRWIPETRRLQAQPALE